MSKVWILIAFCFTSLVMGCSNENKIDDDLEEVSNNSIGPKFDLLTTPVGDVNFPTSCSA
ncbi:MAG: hypothetical protein HOK50_02070, partial [Kordiimonadaceae bacterium]|nr:hypothetical protein [Kordiimonadaceae bacterium]